MEKQVKEKQCEHSQKILEFQNRLKEVQFEVKINNNVYCKDLRQSNDTLI